MTQSDEAALIDYLENYPREHIKLSGQNIVDICAALRSTDGMREALAELYEWCRGLNDFRLDSRLARKVRNALAATKAKIVLL